MFLNEVKDKVEPGVFKEFIKCDGAVAKVVANLKNVNFHGGILPWVPEIFKIPEQNQTPFYKKI